MKWIQKHFRQIIYVSFLFPIILVALVSISHVTAWYEIGNPISWAIYLSIAVEVAALSSLAAIVGKMGRSVYFPFGLVTLIQFIGNVFFIYQRIDINGAMFLSWVEMVGPMMTYINVPEADLIGHQRILSFLLGGLLPVISLSFLGLLVKFEESDGKNKPKEENGKEIDSKDLIGEISKVRLSDEELDNIEDKIKNTKPVSKEETIKKWREAGLLDEPEVEKPTFEPFPIPDITPSPTISATPEPTPDVTPSATPEPTPDVTPSPTPSATPEPTPDATPSATPDVTPSPTPSATPEPTPDVTPSPTPSSTPEVQDEEGNVKKKS